MKQESLRDKLPKTVQGGANLEGAYRYTLWRVWNEQLPRILFVLLNPSTADAERDDPTLLRCFGFALREGCGSLEIVNLFAFRATQLGLLKTTSDPIGPENDRAIAVATQRASMVVLGWGTHGTYLARDRAVLQRLSSSSLYCIGLTKEGHPKHPLYSAFAPLKQFSSRWPPVTRRIPRG